MKEYCGHIIYTPGRVGTLRSAIAMQACYPVDLNELLSTLANCITDLDQKVMDLEGEIQELRDK